MKRLTFVTLLVLSGLLLFSCSKKDSTTSKDSEQPPEQIQVESISVPANMAQSSDPYAQMTVNFITALNGFQQYVTSLTPRGTLSGNDGPPWEYQWTAQGYTAKLVITIENNQYHWKLSFSGSYNGQQVDNATYMEAWQNLDGKWGKLVVYDFMNQGATIAQWEWQEDDTGKLTFTYQEFTNNTKIIVVQNPDLSGSLEMWNGTVLSFKATWNADGSGSWWTYDDNGNETGTGTWG